MGRGWLRDEHGVSVGVEAVALRDGFLVDGEEVVDAVGEEGGDHREEGGSGEVEVGEEGVGALPLVGGGDEESGV